MNKGIVSIPKQTEYTPGVSRREPELLLRTHKNLVHVYYVAFMCPNNIPCLLIATVILSVFECPLFPETLFLRNYAGAVSYLRFDVRRELNRCVMFCFYFFCWNSGNGLICGVCLSMKLTCFCD